VRWLDWESDYDLASTIWPEEFPLELGTWQEARQLGYRYCGVVERQHVERRRVERRHVERRRVDERPVGGQRLLSIAAVWRYSETAWEVAAVRTQPDARRQGYAKAAVSFVTAHILDSGRRATCTTGADNVAMQRTAESVGFVRK